jgi:hypothetical protein
MYFFKQTPNRGHIEGDSRCYMEKRISEGRFLLIHQQHSLSHLFSSSRRSLIYLSVLLYYSGFVSAHFPYIIQTHFFTIPSQYHRPIISRYRIWFNLRGRIRHGDASATATYTRNGIPRLSSMSNSTSRPHKSGFLFFAWPGRVQWAKRARSRIKFVIHFMYIDLHTFCLKNLKLHI